MSRHFGCEVVMGPCGHLSVSTLLMWLWPIVQPDKYPVPTWIYGLDYWHTPQMGLLFHSATVAFSLTVPAGLFIRLTLSAYHTCMHARTHARTHKRTSHARTNSHLNSFVALSAANITLAGLREVRTKTYEEILKFCLISYNMQC